MAATPPSWMTRPRWSSASALNHGYVGRYPVAQITVENPQHVPHGVLAVELDSKRLPDTTIPLRDDGLRHLGRVIMGTDESVIMGTDAVRRPS